MSLSEAIEQGDLQTFQQLLTSGADVNDEDEQGHRPLQVAARNDGRHAVKMVERLLEKGADVHVKDTFDWTPLHIAACNTEHAVKMGELLLEKGADVHVKSKSRNTPLHWAAKNTGEHAVMMVKLLLDQGADVQVKDISDVTPLHWAADNTSEHAVKIVDFLLEKGADVHVKNWVGETPLHRAAKNTGEHAVKMVKLLLDQGADVHVKNKLGWTPLHVAADNTSEHAVKMVELLLARGADVHVKANNGETPLHRAAENTSEHAVKIVGLLLAQRADVHMTSNVKNTDGAATLDIARDEGHDAGDTVALGRQEDTWVVEGGAGEGARQLSSPHPCTEEHADTSHSTLLGLAARSVTNQALVFRSFMGIEQGNMDTWYDDIGAVVSFPPPAGMKRDAAAIIVAVLIVVVSVGAIIYTNRRMEDEHAAHKGHHAVVSLLTRWSLSLAELASEGHTVALGRKLDTGADVNELCPDGRTALHHAVCGDHVAAARLLLQRGADPLRADGNGRIPYDVAGPACKEVLVTLAVEALEDVEEVEGVCGLKETLLGIVQQVQVRRGEGRDTVGLLRNYLFCGSAGTGKTTGARMLARVLHAFGLLSKNHVEEASAQGLTGEYVGQSKTRVEEAMKAARGGVLFVDEAYMLGGDPSGDRARAKLLSMMTEDGYRHSTVVVMAGSRDRIRGLLQRNEGLQSRFTETVHFPDWSPAQCTRFVKKLADEAKPPRVFEPACKEAAHASLDECFAQLREQPGWANARDAQNTFDDVVRQRDRRLAVAPGSPPGITADDTAKACNRFLARRGATPDQRYLNTMQSTESLNCFLVEGLQDSKDS